jgi:hypothetical protein
MMMNRNVKQKFIQSREKALKNTEVQKRILESFRKTTTANVPCYKNKAFETAEGLIADVTAMVSINQFKEWTGLWNTKIL